MTKLPRSLVNLPMTIAISGLVLGSIVVSIAVVSGAIYFNLHAREVAETSVLERNNISVAASVLERRISGSSLKWTDDGDLVSFETFAIPIFYDSRVIDSVTRVVKQDAAILAFDAASQTLISKTASFKFPDGTTELTFAGDSAIYGPVSRGEPFVGEAEIQGQRYFGAAQPILKAGGEVIGAIFVAVPATELQAAANGTLQLILVAGLLITLTLGTIGVLMSRAISKPIPNLAQSMHLIADGNFATAVPYVSQTNEIGGMAKAVEVFRNNGLKVRDLTAAEEHRVRADAHDRQTMMSDLQVAFGSVVDAAIGGDFSRRVDVSFPDSELNSLATSINSLVSNFNRGVMETGQVLGAIAEADLRQRIRGDYAGAFAQLKTSTNAVAEKLTQIVAQLRVTSSGLKIAAGEISSGSVELSERTTRQAAAIEETSAAMEQVASTVLQNARLASDASSSAATMTQ
ncbi:MAG: cache domain-containing protein, partial [Devosia sp.]